MNKKDLEFVENLKFNTLSKKEKRKFLYILILLFIIGWIVNAPDYLNFYSSVPAILNLFTFIYISFVPLWSFMIYNNHYKNDNISYENFFYISGYVLIKLVFSYTLIIFIYVIIYSIFIELYDIALYQFRYYFVNVLSFLYATIFLNKFSKMLKKIKD